MPGGVQKLDSMTIRPVIDGPGVLPAKEPASAAVGNAMQYVIGAIDRIEELLPALQKTAELSPEFRMGIQVKCLANLLRVAVAQGSEVRIEFQLLEAAK